MLAPVKVLVTGITESLAVSVTSPAPSTLTVATAAPWTSTAMPSSAVTPAQAHAGCPGQPSAARAAMRTRSLPSPAAAATSAQHAEQRVRVRPAAVRHGDERAVTGDHARAGERDAADDLHPSLMRSRNRGT